MQDEVVGGDLDNYSCYCASPACDVDMPMLDVAVNIVT
jgi:hypothetical protein